MDRRKFVAGSAAVAISALLLPTVSISDAYANANFIDYKPGVIENALKSGKTVFVDYSAWWCTTCRSQSRTLDKLVEANPAYATKMLFVRVDWDKFKKQPVTLDRQVPRRSTLLVLRGTRELGRVVAGTDPSEIKSLLDKGL